MKIEGSVLHLLSSRCDVDDQGGVSRWRDQLGNGNDAVQPIHSLRPKLIDWPKEHLHLQPITQLVYRSVGELSLGRLFDVYF